MNTYVLVSNSPSAPPTPLTFETPPPCWLVLAEDGERILRVVGKAQLRPPRVEIVVGERASTPEEFQEAAQRTTRALLGWVQGVVITMVDAYPAGNRLFIWYQEKPYLTADEDGVVSAHCNVAVCLAQSPEPPLPLGKHLRVDTLWEAPLELDGIEAPDPAAVSRWALSVSRLLSAAMLPPEPAPPEVGSL